MKLTTYIHHNLEYIIFAILVITLIILISKRNWETFYIEKQGINKLDAIIYINLENRNDRKELLLKELETLDIIPSKLHKVSGVYMPKNGHKGCIQSHILALNMIKLNKWSHALILEDDAQITYDPIITNTIMSETLDKLNIQNPDWNVIMLATANKQINTKFIPIELDISSETTKYVINRLKRATTSSAYIVKGSYVDTILELFNMCNNNMNSERLSGDNYEYWALDQKWASLQESDQWFCISPDPFKQRDIWSTILNESHKPTIN